MFEFKGEGIEEVGIVKSSATEHVSAGQIVVCIDPAYFRPTEVELLIGDASKAKNELGWEPSVTFEEGLGKTIDWYLANQEWLDHVTSGDYQKYYQQQYTHS